MYTIKQAAHMLQKRGCPIGERTLSRMVQDGRVKASDQPVTPFATRTRKMISAFELDRLISTSDNWKLELTVKEE